jgi:hypothetical protein
LGVGRGADDPIPEKKKLRYGNLEDASEGFNKEDGGEELKTGTSGGTL